mmetsp:Transcript_28164/g.51949  ORF Transcript_28164/g.51949 Transcript_28164/m.51949 type:complete len:112 (-) Transcript_28164:760-1095(-)|eukprot:CAMPEP_0175075222 /NCGR_PEP_ID=MMETSP0052_2-20121109/21846_1 /TAXON_ID=51329 ORGANISM="Polytomella parva, Strain SAG 63-3" /NCGR_SAMPLE_ID=MMETSP0052_2 /ASSEMBLY_ACC=CAM_ASM_000194 /LENGTH=111 /DNA_ID=CAMNT_0016343815 /DNA_START=23 /DNA_END=358 /DNA_ORIENTATION=-
MSPSEFSSSSSSLVIRPSLPPGVSVCWLQPPTIPEDDPVGVLLRIFSLSRLGSKFPDDGSEWLSELVDGRETGGAAGRVCVDDTAVAGDPAAAAERGGGGGGAGLLVAPGA